MTNPKFEHVDLTMALCNEMYPLMEEHYLEVAHFKDIKLKPQFDKYIKFAAAGQVHVFTARDEISNRIIGYAWFYLQSNTHYADSYQAHQDVIYIDPKCRGFGRRFIAWCDEQLKNLGAEVVYHHVKKSHNFGPMLERMGYELIDYIYGRKL